MQQTALVRAAWVADGVLLVAAAPAAGPPSGPRQGGVRTLAARAVGPAAGSTGAALLIGAQAPATLLDEPAARIMLDAGETVVATTAGDLRDALTDLQGFLRDHVAPWDAAARAAAIELAVAVAAGAPPAPSLAEGLRDVREALRERHALAVVDERVDRAVGVERLHRIDDHSFYAAGWVWDPTARLTALTAVAPEGERVELLGEAFRYERADVGDRFGAPADRRGCELSGFVCHFMTRAPSVLADGWVFEAAGEAGRGVETHLALTTNDPAQARAAIVADAALESARADDLRERHVRPALTRLQELRRETATIATDEALGRPPPAAPVSVIVPLYERADLLEHQLAQFAADPAIGECELIYVLDSPEQRDHVREYATQLFRLYGLPFRVVTLAANGGVALARDAGVSVASAGRLLFLDSDALPDRPGWLPRLSEHLDREPRVAAVAPKLVYEDETVQHGGVRFERPPGAAEWEASPRFKGLHRRAAAANVSGAVPALSGACLMVDAGAYRETGGMSWLYVQGDYEDADLCMRLDAAGRECRYVAEVELYHLEAQSYFTEARAANRRYNRWLHTRLWGARIEALA